MIKLAVIILTKNEPIPFKDWYKADTVLRATDVPGVYKVLVSRHTSKAGSLIHIKDWK